MFALELIDQVLCSTVVVAMDGVSRVGESAIERRRRLVDSTCTTAGAIAGVGTSGDIWSIASRGGW